MVPWYNMFLLLFPCLSVLKWAVVAESFLSFTTQEHVWQSESVIMSKQHHFYKHVFLEKWINFQKFCDYFLLLKRNVMLNMLFLCRVFISKYQWKYWLTSNVCLIFLTSEKIFIQFVCCVFIIRIPFISKWICLLCLFPLIKSLVN